MDFEQACKAGDLARVRHYFATTSLTAQDATRCSVACAPNVEVMRCLLENGADIATFMRQKSPDSLDMIKLFGELGYDVKAERHKILQQVRNNLSRRIESRQLTTSPEISLMTRKPSIGSSTAAPTSTAPMKRGKTTIFTTDWAVATIIP